MGEKKTFRKNKRPGGGYIVKLGGREAKKGL